ncbi:riboflavin biosynthesis protein RibF [uncultured Flavonifractor sp.]|uniref:riboflavin biosynthesis protein RibF n=1 Tax=uncultured Flavonifractor sp. TaxID=1193534 RepID=UPI002619D9B2|nr:riboflavin biosynthesis protein RibF [uncultured Flavonifractor sp.]
MRQDRRVIALGFFDGVHLGHGALLRRVGELAEQLNAVPAAVTFDTHPENLILKTSGVPLLSSPLDRAELMRRCYGIRDVIVAHFDERMMHMPWQQFVTDYLVGENGAVHLVAGHDFHFGYKGEGNPERLVQLCGELGLGCDIIPKVERDHITVSSTYIRTLIAQGEMERANDFLGHPHTLTDTVIHGKKLGSTLGFPTVNLRFQPGVLVPAYGVYATRVWFENGESRPAVTNIGVRPTVDDGDKVTVEGFILDFSGDLYGQSVRMEFYKRLRGERKFSDLAALKEEVMRNAEQTRAYFKGR